MNKYRSEIIEYALSKRYLKMYYFVDTFPVPYGYIAYYLGDLFKRRASMKGVDVNKHIEIIRDYYDDLWKSQKFPLYFYVRMESVRNPLFYVDPLYVKSPVADSRYLYLGLEFPNDDLVEMFSDYFSTIKSILKLLDVVLVGLKDDVKRATLSYGWSIFDFALMSLHYDLFKWHSKHVIDDMKYFPFEYQEIGILNRIIPEFQNKLTVNNSTSIFRFGIHQTPYYYNVLIPYGASFMYNFHAYYLYHLSTIGYTGTIYFLRNMYLGSARRLARELLLFGRKDRSLIFDFSVSTHDMIFSEGIRYTLPFAVSRFDILLRTDDTGDVTSAIREIKADENNVHENILTEAIISDIMNGHSRNVDIEERFKNRDSIFSERVIRYFRKVYGSEPDIEMVNLMDLIDVNDLMTSLQK